VVNFFRNRSVIGDLGREEDGRADRGLEERLLEPEGFGRVAAVGEDLVQDGTGTGRLAPDGDVRRVAAKLADVLLHPLQGELLCARGKVVSK
jgi:hypothetical protein